MASITVFPAAGTAGTTGDAYVYRSAVNQTFGNIRSGAGVGVDNTDVDILVQLQASATSNQFQALDRALITFDTSALTASASISAAVLSLYDDGKTNGLGSPALHVAGATPSVNANFVAADYGQMLTTSFANIAYASWNAGAYNAFTLDANGIANVSKTGISKFSAQLSWDILNSFTGVWASNAGSNFLFFSADQSGTSNDPKLVITYTVASGPANIKTYEGLASASTKLVQELAIASVKTKQGLA